METGFCKALGQKSKVAEDVDDIETKYSDPPSTSSPLQVELRKEPHAIRASLNELNMVVGLECRY